MCRKLSFYIRRFFRIAPLYYAAIVVYFVRDGFEPRYWAPEGTDVTDVVLTVFFLNGWDPFTLTSVVPGGWSIVAEMCFYLIFPMLACLINTRIKSFIAVLLAVIFESALATLLAPYFYGGVSAENQYVVHSFLGFMWFPATLPVFLCVFCVYHAIRGKAGLHREYPWLFISSGGLLAMSTLVIEYPLGMHVVFAIAFALIIMGLSAKPDTFLLNPFMRFVGQLSYSLYIVHFGVMSILRSLLEATGISLRGDLYFLLALALTLSLSMACAWVSMRLIERPGIRLGSDLIRHLQVCASARRPALSL